MASPRTSEILTSLSGDMVSHHDHSVAYSNALTRMVQQYKSIVDDLQRMKTRYVEIIQNYTGAQERRPSTASLPGLAHSAPYNTPAMKAETDELYQLSELIGELENQKDLVYAQVRKLLEAIISSTSNLVDTATQIDQFLDKQIDESNVGGLYGHERVNLRSAAALK